MDYKENKCTDCGSAFDMGAATDPAKYLINIFMDKIDTAESSIAYILRHKARFEDEGDIDALYDAKNAIPLVLDEYDVLEHTLASDTRERLQPVVDVRSEAYRLAQRARLHLMNDNAKESITLNEKALAALVEELKVTCQTLLADDLMEKNQ